jgi:hypothetical protein
MTFAAIVAVFGFIVNTLLFTGFVATNTQNSQRLEQSALVLLYPLQEQHPKQPEHARQLYIHHNSSSIDASIDTNFTPPQAQPHQLQYHHDKLMFVHIGKTAGETLKHHLRVTCTTPRRSAAKRNKCHKEWQTTIQNNETDQTATTTTTTMNVVRHESEISKRTVAYIHCNMLQPSSRGIHAAVQEQITSHLFCIRSPVDRIFSWFHYIHPNGCRKTRHDTPNCVYKRRIVHENNTLVATFAMCFPTLLHFLDSLGRPPPSSPPATTAVRSNSNNNRHNLEVCAQTAHAILQATSTNVSIM